MKQRGKRNNSKLVHVSFDEVERFVPRVPKQICPDEDNTTPRICVAPNILSAIQAMPQGGTVAYNMARIGVPVVIHAYYIESDAILMPEQIADKVPDAVATGEMWVMAVPAAVRRYGYEWESMADEQKEKILAEKTVIMSGDSGYACKRYQIIGNANNLSDHECAIIADGGNLCFGYRMEGQEIVVYTD